MNRGASWDTIRSSSEVTYNKKLVIFNKKMKEKKHKIAH